MVHSLLKKKQHFPAILLAPHDHPMKQRLQATFLQKKKLRQVMFKSPRSRSH